MSDWTMGALVSVRVKSDSPKQHRVLSRQHQFVVGQPITFDREDPQVSAVEYLVGAFAADLMGTFRKVARRERLVVEEFEVVASGEMDNPLTFLGVVGEAGEPALKSLNFKCYLGTSGTRAEVDRIWALALQRSPLFTTLQSAFSIETELQIIT